MRAIFATKYGNPDVLKIQEPEAIQPIWRKPGSDNDGYCISSLNVR